MFSGIYYIVLFVLQLVFLVKAVKRKNKNVWKSLFAIEISSILSIVPVFIFSSVMSDTMGWYVLTFIIFSGYAIFVFLIMLIISISVRIVHSKKLETAIAYAQFNGTYQQEDALPVVVKSIFIVVMCLVTSLSLEVINNNISLDKKEKQYADDLIQAKQIATRYLTDKYGDGNFTIEKDATEKRSNFFTADEIYQYTLTMSTNYMDSEFNIVIDRNSLEVANEDFLEVYYNDTKGIEDLEYYITNYKVETLNKSLSKKFNATIDFISSRYKADDQKLYGKIPSINELTENVVLIDPRFDIKEKSITSYQQLTEYLVDLTRFFLTDIYNEQIQYNSYFSYYRYKFDFVSLGDENYTDQYDGYGGYVMAGEYKYSDTEGRYIKVNEDTVVRVYNTRTIAEYTVDDILENK